MRLQYKALLRRSEQRLRTGLGYLAQRKKTLGLEQDRLDQLNGELELRRNLMQAGRIDGWEVSRQQLFSWLRTTSADQRRNQDLNLDMKRQKDVVDDLVQRVDAQKMHCDQLEKRRRRHETMFKVEKKRMRLRQLEMDENEIEEHLSWVK